MSEPDAWGLLDEGEVHYATPFRDEADSVLRRTGDTDSAIVPLYRSPALTDEEREAIDRARRVFRDMSHNDMTMQQLEDYEALCGLLERTSRAAT